MCFYFTISGLGILWSRGKRRVSPAYKADVNNAFYNGMRRMPS